MRRISFEVGLVLLVLVVHLYPLFVPDNSLVMSWFGSDDAFYYFKTAQNIAEGRGITFDGLGRDSGFHPLWMLIITPVFALARLNLLLPLRIIVIISALLSLGTGLLLYRLAKRRLGPLAARFVALFWVFHPYVHRNITQMGMESAISAFFIALLIYLVALKMDEPESTTRDAAAILRPALAAGVVGILTVFARLDNIFLVLLAGAWLAVRPVRMRYLLLSDVALISLGVLWTYMERVGFGARFAQNAPAVYWMIMLALAIRIIVYYLLGMYHLPGMYHMPGMYHLPGINHLPEAGGKALARYLGRAVAASLLATVLLSAAMLALQALGVFPGFPRLTLAYEAGTGLAALLAVRTAAILLTRGEPYKAETLHWRPTFLRLAGFAAPIALGLAVYMGLSQWYYGTPMPVSGQIKRWWGTLPNTVYGHPVESLKGMLGFPLDKGPWELVSKLIAWPQALPEWLRILFYGGIALAVLILMWKRSRSAIHGLALFPLFVGSIVQLISYTGTGYLHMRGWYWASSMMATTLLLGILMDQLLCRSEHFSLRGIPLPRLANTLGLVLCAIVVLYGVEEIVRRMPMRLNQRMQGYYLEGIHKLEKSTEPGSIIGSTGGGVIAYFIEDRTVVNMDGLMNTTEYFHLLQQGQAAGYLDRIGLDYVTANELMITDSDPYFQFKSRLEKLDEIGGAALFKWHPGK